MRLFRCAFTVFVSLVLNSLRCVLCVSIFRIVVFVCSAIVVVALNCFYIITRYTLYSRSVCLPSFPLFQPSLFASMLYSFLLDLNFSVFPFALVQPFPLVFDISCEWFHTYIRMRARIHTAYHLYLFPSISVATCDAFHYKLNHFCPIDFQSM